MKATLTILALFLSLTIFSQDKTEVTYSQDKTEIIVLKIQQNYALAGRIDSHIRISYPDEKTKTIKLAKAGFSTDDAAEDSNTKIIQKTINELTAEGYKIISSDISGDQFITRTLMLFERKK